MSEIMMKIDNSASNVQQHGLWSFWADPQLLRPDGHSNESGGEDAEEDWRWEAVDGPGDSEEGAGKVKGEEILASQAKY